MQDQLLALSNGHWAIASKVANNYNIILTLISCKEVEILSQGLTSDTAESPGFPSI